MPSCDIIIPTYNNARILPQALAGLAEQRVPAGWTVKVILSDDGSSDGTLALAKDARQNFPFEIKIIHNEHAGVAHARNVGIKASTADIIFFLGADIILAANALAVHLNWHLAHPKATSAALGFVMWDPLCNPSPLMEWMMHGGPQNNFDALLGEAWAAPEHFFYSSHISLKRAALTGQDFSADFSSYGWEDLELGRRLARAGLKLGVLEGVWSWHAHRYTLDDILKRQRLAGHNLVIYHRKHPSAGLLPSPRKKRYFKYLVLKYSGLLECFKAMVSLFPQNSYPRIYSVLCATYFWLGIWDND